MNYKVIYILSVGHSGSTLLDIMLGQFNNTFSTGELKHLTWQLYRELNGIENAEGKCTCNRKFLECILWSKIIDEIKGSKNIDVKSIPSELKLKYFEYLNYFDNSIFLKMLRRLYKSNLRFKIIPASVISNYFKNVTTNNLLLFDSINKIVTTEYIIDSSKDIIRFYELHKELKENIFPIILIRNVNKIVKSKYINDSKRNAVSNAWINYYNYHVLPLIKTMNDRNFYIVSYEAFIDNPMKIIVELSKKINLDPSEFMEQVSINNMHLCAGNPMRYSENVKIEKQKINTDKYFEEISNSGLDSFYIDQIYKQIN